MDRSEARSFPHYRAFISYSHHDVRFAARLHRALEAYRLPPHLRGPGVPRTLHPIFRDREELRADGDLSAQVQQALADSAALIVIASPQACASRWVAREIDLFRTAAPGRPVLVALASGEPGEAIPPALFGTDGAMEPLAADFRPSGDGERLARLKLIAALADVPLASLVRRDAQRRRRAVIAVTAAASLLVLVLSGLLVLATRARAEAERQRAEAEGLIAFMLTDLRDRLKGVGRLDVLDVVNARAMAHYSGQDLRGLPDDNLKNRSQILMAMAEDNLEKDNISASARQAEQAHAIARALYDRSPARAENAANLGFAENMEGMVAFARKDFAATLRHSRAYLTLAREAARLDPANPKMMRYVMAASANLCASEQQLPQEIAASIRDCQQAAALSRQQFQRSGTVVDRVDAASSLAWLADAYGHAGNWKAAVGQRREQLALVSSQDPVLAHDVTVMEARMLARTELAEALLKDGEPAEARERLRQARADVEGLLAIERRPAWTSARDKITRLLSEGE